MEYIKLETSGNVGIVTMNYKKENRFNPAFVSGMLEMFDRIENDDEIRAAVYTGGDPKFFSNGLDLEWIMSHADDEEALMAYLNSLGKMTKRLCLFPKPMVAALNGHAFAGGILVASYFDFRFMREDKGWVCVPEIDLNMPLPPSMIAIMQAILPPKSFRDMYYTGRRYTGPEAVELGFVDAVYPADELVARSVEFAEELAKKKTATYAEYKLRIRAHIAHIIEEIDPKFHKKSIDFVLAAIKK